MPKAKAVARNGDRSPDAYSMGIPEPIDVPVEQSRTYPAFRSTLSLKNSIREKGNKKD